MSLFPSTLTIHHLKLLMSLKDSVLELFTKSVQIALSTILIYRHSLLLLKYKFNYSLENNKLPVINFSTKITNKFLGMTERPTAFQPLWSHIHMIHGFQFQNRLPFHGLFKKHQEEKKSLVVTSICRLKRRQ